MAGCKRIVNNFCWFFFALSHLIFSVFCTISFELILGLLNKYGESECKEEERRQEGGNKPRENDNLLKLSILNAIDKQSTRYL